MNRLESVGPTSADVKPSNSSESHVALSSAFGEEHMDQELGETPRPEETTETLRFVSIMEQLRKRNVKYMTFIDTCALEDVTTMGIAFVRAHGVCAKVRHHSLPIKTDASPRELVRLLISAYGFAMYPMDDYGLMINGVGMRMVRECALKMVEATGALVRCARQNRLTAVRGDQFTAVLNDRLCKFEEARATWFEGDTAHAICRLEDAIKIKQMETVVLSPFDRAAIETLGKKMREMMKGMIERMGEAKAVFKVRLAKSQRRVVRAKRELTRLKQIINGMRVEWGEEMEGDIRNEERREAEIRHYLRTLTNRQVVESEDNPTRYLVRVETVSEDEAAFADQFLNIASDLEEEEDDDGAAEPGVAMMLQRNGESAQDSTDALLFYNEEVSPADQAGHHLLETPIGGVL
jgi:hypothetical protein